MADPTITEPRSTGSSSAKATDSAASSPELAPVMKLTPARATKSSVPGTARRAARSLTPEARPANVEIYQGGADSVAGDSVSITQGGASVVNARSVEIHQGGIGNAQADEINVRMGGVALARADRVSVEMGGVGLSLAREATLTQGGARTIIAQDIHVDQGLVGTAFAGKVSFAQPSGVFLLIAGKTEGPVKAAMDWRGALAFGAAFGLVAGLLRRR